MPSILRGGLSSPVLPLRKFLQIWWIFPVSSPNFCSRPHSARHSGQVRISLTCSGDCGSLVSSRPHGDIKTCIGREFRNSLAPPITKRNFSAGLLDIVGTERAKLYRLSAHFISYHSNSSSSTPSTAGDFFDAEHSSSYRSARQPVCQESCASRRQQAFCRKWI